MHRTPPALVLALLAAAACSETHAVAPLADAAPRDSSRPEPWPPPCVKGGDTDGDRIPDEVEGCQRDLGNTMQVIIDSITGTASGEYLDFVPISASLAAALDARPLQRSRSQGFDFRPASNDLVFASVDYHKGSEIYVSYKYWRRPVFSP